jgi:hypothetical protein
MQTTGNIILAQQKQEKVKNQDYQIFLSKPAKAIRLLMYEKNFVPIQGTLSEDKKSIIIKNYESGSKVHVKVEYEDGTVDEFVKSPCFIDPVVSLKSLVISSMNI